MPAPTSELLPREVLVPASALIGLPVGALVNLVGDLLPRDPSREAPPGCPACGEAARGRLDLALVSRLTRGARCRQCGTRLSLRRPAIELLTALLFLAIAWRHGAQLMLPIWCAFAAALVACAAIDLEHRVVPDELSLGGLLVALLVVPAAVGFGGGPFADTLARASAGALLGGGSLWLLGFAHARASAALGRRFEHWPGPGEALPTPGSLDYWTWFPGVGLGDIKLMAMVGAVLGPLGVVEAIAASSVAGVAFGLAARRWSAPFGFAPAIAAGALAVVLVPGHLLRP